ncbi:MAG: 7-cyano-7-deazaguanine synthase QueC [Acidobacteria bacterium]|nr:7-cyano-7-deazaguanine synthase QueC [Planctomycetota bacterium]MBE3134539.1 7-cyano-7-deazaguanine synthase QueC [Acidobacteriota bacterium]
MTTTRPLAVALASGGMDSCVAAAWAARHYRLAMLHVNYGQRTEAKEARCFRQLTAHFHAEKALVVEAPYLGQVGGSSLTDFSIPVPEDDRPGEIPSTYVPFRNANLLAMATSWAEVIGASRLVIGAVEQDAPGYPDCRPAFYEAATRLIALGTRPETSILVDTPLIALRKADVIRLGMELGAPLELTWSCYRSEDAPCRRCASCRRREEAFAEVGVADPLLAGA